jgi:predicted small secreted protein
MKRFIMAILAVTVLSLTLAACSSSKGTSTADGAKAMQSTLTDLQKQIDAKDAGKVKDDAKKLEDSWASFEDNVKSKTPDLYAKVEAPLGIIQAGAQASPLDTAVLTSAVKELNNVLNELAK